MGDGARGHLGWPKAVAVLLRWVVPTRAHVVGLSRSLRGGPGLQPRSPASRTHTQTGSCSSCPRWGRCVHRHWACRGALRRDTAPGPLNPPSWGPGNHSPPKSTGPQGGHRELSRLRMPVAVGLSPGIWEGSRVGVPQGSHSLRLTPPFPALTLGPSGPCVALRGQHCPESDPRLTSTLLEHSGAGAGAGGWGSLGCTAPAPRCVGPRGQEPRLWRAAASWPRPHLFSMSVCTLWTRSRAILRISWAS